MDLIDEIDGIAIKGRSEKDVMTALARYIRRAIIPYSLFDLQKTEFLPRDWDILEHVLEKAEEAKAVFKKDVLDAASLVKLGNLLFCKNDFPKAQELYRRSIEVQELPVALKNLGVALLSDGRPVEARDVLEKAIKADPKDHQVLFYIGLTWEAVAEGRGRSQAGGGMAVTALDDGQVKEHFNNALRYYNEALAIEPKFGPALYNKSVVLSLLGRKEEAREMITNMLKGQPASEPGWIARGLILRASDDLEGALKCYENAILINPDSHLAWLNKSVLLFAMKRLKEALEAAEKAIDLHQPSEIAWSNKGAILSEMGRYKEALRCFDKALALNPGFEGAKRNKEKALADLKRAGGKDKPAARSAPAKKNARAKARTPKAAGKARRPRRKA